MAARFKLQTVVALLLCTVILGGNSSSADPLAQHPARKAPRNPPDNGPRPVGGAHGGPGYKIRGGHYYFESRQNAYLDVFANDEYPSDATVCCESAGYAYLTWVRCPSGRLCLFYEPVEGERPYPDRVDYALKDPRGGGASGEVEVHMP